MIAADLPLGLASGDAVGFGDGPPCARELEIADLLSFIKHGGVRNTVWITADVHYTAAHHYDPNRAQLQDFAPFWEFVSGPIHAGTWWPSDLDNTFGPRVMFSEGVAVGAGQPAAELRPAVLRPCGDRRRASEVITVTLKHMANTGLWSVDIPPAPLQRIGPS